MKRFILSIMTIILCLVPLFADEPGDEYDDGFVYESNGKGDQFLKFEFSACFPLNFDKIDEETGTKYNQLKPGASFDVGYYRFANKWFGYGGEFTFTSNWSIGNKLLVTIPITPGIVFQPYVGSFEFPIYLNVGIGYESWANTKYFPSLVVKSSAGMYYRINEAWSVGGCCSGMWIPQWFEDSKYNHNGFFINANIGGRFHF